MAQILQQLVGGLVANAVTKLIMSPLDVTRVVQQLGIEATPSEDPTTPKPQYDLVDSVKFIYQRAGVGGFFAGMSVSLLRFIPTQVASVTGRLIATYVDVNEDDATPVAIAKIIFIAGVPALATVTVSYPFEMAYTRAVLRKLKLTSRSQALTMSELRRRHGLAAWYRGIVSSSAGLLLYRFLFYFTYNTADRLLPGQTIARVAVRGMLATIVTGVATYPVDLIRRRQLADPVTHKSTVTCARTIVQREGLRGLFAGMTSVLVLGALNFLSALGSQGAPQDQAGQQMSEEEMAVLLKQAEAEAAEAARRGDLPPVPRDAASR